MFCRTCDDVNQIKRMKQTNMKHWKISKKDFKDQILDCYLEIRCFYEFGGHALQILPKVLPNIFRHFGITNEILQNKIINMAEKHI